MAVLSRTSVILAFVCSIVGYAWCYSTGAPTAACVTMWPGHFSNGQQINGQTGDSPYQVETDSTDFTSGQTVTVTVSADPGVTYKGFLLQARLVDSSSDTPVGVFRNLPNEVKTLTCSNTDDSVTHSDSSFKATVSVEWLAPNDPVGDIEFVATVVHSKSIFWRQLKSSALTALFPCDPNPCLNGGTCFQAADGQSYFCGCVDPANKNPNCEVPCSPNPCQNRGICQESGDSFTCFCPADRYGPVCENLIIPCSTNPCLNDATCTDTGTGHQCTCAMGWSGTDCGTNLFCMPDSCMNGGTCFDSNPAGSEMFYCQCAIYYTGSRCETADPCRASPCANSGVCSQIGNTTEFSCTCPDGFEGDRCETTSNPCQTNPCLNGGLCYQSNEGNRFCQCTEEYTGENCNTTINPCMLPTTPCLNGATCMSGSGTSYDCQCPSAYSGMHCETLVDPCQSNPCVNGGTCESEPEEASYTCSCPAEYFGSNCQNRGACFGVTCNNRGNCMAQPAQTGYTCICTGPYDGQDCQHENMCETNNQCSEGSTCHYIGQGFVECECPPGLGGQFCESDISCNGNPCRNGGTCMSSGGGNYECKCGAAYSGANCETYTNPCVPNPCVHGTCRIDLQLPIGRECMCNENYIGVNCSVYDGNPCDVFECDNGGTCIDRDSTAVCVCTMEYAGLRCETPTHPVFNGCPSGVSPSFPLLEGSNQAYIDLLITATDQEGKDVPLDITDDLSFPSTIAYTEEYREGKMIVVVAEDDEGRRSTCEFTLRIFDNEVPSLFCPSDVSAITTGDAVAVTWPMATATDNLAITDPLQYSPSNGSEFTAGESTVIVKGLDTFDNQGQCTFKVTVHKKASDCTAFTGPDNGESSCIVVGDQRMCSITCSNGFGNAIGDDEYTCVYETTAHWDPRPNTDICVPFKPGNGVYIVAMIQFSIESTACNAIDFVSLVKNSLKSFLESLGICDPITSSISCEISVACENASGRRRKRAPTDLNVDVSLMSLALNGDSNSDVQMRLDDAVSALMTAAASGSLSIEVDGQTINNEPTAFDLSDNTWSCKPGQISSSDGCLSCPPGSFHNTETNKCDYCPLSTYQNKPEQDSCVSCPEGTETQQTGAFSADLCGPMNKPREGPWTPTLIAIVSAAGGLIVLLLIILACVYIVKCSRRSSDRADSRKDPDGPLSNFTHLNRAYEEEGEEPEMQFHGGPSMTSDTTYQNVEDDVLDTGSTDHLVRIPSLSQYSDFYASVKARSAPVPDSPPPPPPVAAPEPPVANGGPPSPPPAPPAPPASDLNMNNSNTSTSHTYQNGTLMNGGSKAKFQV